MLEMIDIVFWTFIKILGILGATLGIIVIVLGIFFVIKITLER